VIGAGVNCGCRSVSSAATCDSQRCRIYEEGPCVFQASRLSNVQCALEAQRVDERPADGSLLPVSKNLRPRGVASVTRWRVNFPTAVVWVQIVD
jgi:hypothetical protein